MSADLLAFPSPNDWKVANKKVKERIGMSLCYSSEEKIELRAYALSRYLTCCEYIQHSGMVIDIHQLIAKISVLRSLAWP